MKPSEINPAANYRNEDERLGDPGTYSGAEILAQLTAFGVDGDFEGDEDWDIEEVSAASAAAAALGRSRTPKKAAASRENGKRGGRPPLPSCHRCGAKVKAAWWRAMDKAGFAPRHLSCPSCGCEGVEAWPRPE